MDIYADRATLAAALNHAAAVADRKAGNPDLSAVYLSVTDRALVVSACDTEAGVRVTMGIEGHAGEVVATSAADLTRAVRALDGDTVRLCRDGRGRLEVSAGRSSYRLPVLAEASEQRITARADCKVSAAGVAHLGAALGAVAHAIGTADRYGLNGIHVEREGDLLRFVATDGHRLAVATCAADVIGDVPPKLLLPRRMAEVAAKHAAGQVCVDLGGDGTAEIAAGGVSWTFRLLEGEFPDYRAILPDSYRTRAVVARDALVGAVKRVSIVTGRAGDAVPARVAISAAGEVQISARTADHGEASDIISADVEGPALIVGLRPSYVLDALAMFDAAEVVLEANEPLGPVRVSAVGGGERYAIIMPMRLS